MRFCIVLYSEHHLEIQVALSFLTERNWRCRRRSWTLRVENVRNTVKASASCADVASVAVSNGADSISPKQETGIGDLKLVRATGVEPARPCGHQPLKLARLPIPPRAHGRICSANSSVD